MLGLYLRRPESQSPTSRKFHKFVAPVTSPLDISLKHRADVGSSLSINDLQTPGANHRWLRRYQSGKVNMNPPIYIQAPLSKTNCFFLNFSAGSRVWRVFFYFTCDDWSCRTSSVESYMNVPQGWKRRQMVSKTELHLTFFGVWCNQTTYSHRSHHSKDPSSFEWHKIEGAQCWENMIKC